MMAMVQLNLGEVREICSRCLMLHDADHANAGAVADTVTAAERDGCHSHGLFRVPGYVASLKSGKVNGASQPKIRKRAAGVLEVDADGGFSPYALQISRESFIALTKEQGIAALSMHNSYHFAALWPETEALAEAGLVAFAFTEANAYVAPAGGTKPLYGTNPMSFAWPRVGAPPLVFDQSSSVMARGELQIAARDGHTVPEGAGIDADGQPTTDPNAILAGAQLPFGGYKGAAIALMVELLVGGLTGDNFSFEATAGDNRDGGPTRGGEFMMAMDPNKFSDPGGWSDHAEMLFAKIREQSGTRLPSDRRFANRKKTPQTGTQIPESLHTTLQGLLEAA